MSQGDVPPVEHPLFAALTVLEQGVAALGAANPWSLSDAEVLEALDRWAVVSAQLAVGGLGLVAEADGRNLAAAGATTTAGLLRGRLLLGPGEATRAVKLALALGECTATGTALAWGACTEEQARVITTAVTALPPVEADIKAQAEAFLIGQAAVLDPLLIDHGETALHNLVLLCQHHHAAHHHGWQVTLRHRRTPRLPPPWIDPEQQPRQHHRYQLRQLGYDLSGHDPPE